MNFNTRLRDALRTLTETHHPGVLEAALDEYIDRYGGNLQAIAQHTMRDLAAHYRPQLQALRATAIAQQHTRNSRGSNDYPDFFSYLHELDTYIDPGNFGPHGAPGTGEGPLETLQGLITNITTCAHNLALGAIADRVDDNTWVKLEQIVDEIRGYLTVIHGYLEKL